MLSVELIGEHLWRQRSEVDLRMYYSKKDEVENVYKGQLVKRRL